MAGRARKLDARTTRRNKRARCTGLVALLLWLGALSVADRLPAQERKLSGYERGLAHSMLKNILGDLKKNYYDPTFHGFDINARFRQADQSIDQATSFNQVFALISWALDGLNDSHTFFVPPPRSARYEFGWHMEPVGNRCLVTAVKPGTDAEKKGLKPGDQITALDGYLVNRDTLPGLERFFSVLLPQTSLTATLQDSSGARKNLTIQAEVQRRIQDLTVWGENVRDLPKMSYAWAVEHRSRDKSFGSSLIIWKMNVFLSDSDVSSEWEKARRCKALVLDLRGNEGGRAEVLARMVRGLFDRDVKIGERKDRKRTSDWVVKGGGKEAFQGKVIVLVDSETASAAEILARVIQLEKRGIVIGDRTAGDVLEAKFLWHRSSPDNAQIIFYGAAVTEADLIMSDGKRLEHVGVTPDELLLPSPADLAARRDPVLAHAANLAGTPLTPEEAGKLFPPLWERVVLE